MKILCVGLSAYDITYPLEGYLKENTKNRTNTRVECSGGSANNSAYLLGKWNEEVYYAGCVGNDTYGKSIIKELESVNVNTDYMQTKNNMTTIVSNIIANIKDGTRTVLTYCKDDIKIDDLDLEFEPDMLLIDGHEYEASMQVLDKFPNVISILDADRINDEIIELAKKVKYLICSKQFAETIAETKIDFNNPNSIISTFNKLKSMFKNNIIITLESKGSLYEIEGKIKIMPSLKVKSVDSTGAGDFFHAAFAYAIANNYNYENAIKFANITGALSVTKIGSKQSAPSIEEVEKIYDEYK